MKPKSRVSIKDIAQEAGVSVQTVSRVVNNKDGVGEETRNSIRQIIDRLGYRPNEVARSLVAGRSNTIACISQSLTDYALASIIKAIKKQAQAKGYFVLTGEAEDENETRNLIDIFLSRQTDGLVIIDPGMDGRYTYIQELVMRGFPLVYISTTPRGEPVSYVNCDDLDVGYQATAYLIQLGHRSIATITGPLQEENAAMRFKGYQRALSEAGIAFDPRLVETSSWLSSGGYDAAKRLNKKAIPFTGLVIQSDPLAIGASCALRELEIAIPEQVSVIGADDHPWVAYMDPPLTTMRQDMAAIGQQAANLLLDRIENPDWTPQGILVKTELVVRKSCKALIFAKKTR